MRAILNGGKFNASNVGAIGDLLALGLHARALPIAPVVIAFTAIAGSVGTVGSHTLLIATVAFGISRQAPASDAEQTKARKPQDTTPELCAHASI